MDNSTGSTADTPDGIPDSDQYQIYFGASTSSSGSTATGRVTAPASSVSIMPRWAAGDGTLSRGSAQYDVAVITLNLGMVTSGTLPSARLGFSMTSPLGRTGTMVGYGSYGTGNSFAGNGADGVRRAGNNTIDFVANDPGDSRNNPFGFTVQTDFDSPRDASKSSLGSAIPLTLEATTAGGDSGGPLLIQDGTGQYLIAGVLNGGRIMAGLNASEYGDRSVWASILQANNYQYLMAQGIAVPEPSTWTLLGLGMVGAAAALLRRRHALA